MQKPYYFGAPQLFRMPLRFRAPGPSLTDNRAAAAAASVARNGLSGTCACGNTPQTTFDKVLPFAAVGIAAIVGHNIYLSLKK